jgi:hypothetical protein
MASSPTPKPQTWRAVMRTSIAAICSRRSRAAIIRAGPRPSRSCPTQTPDYRLNPFDLTKTWPHKDYPLIKVGRMRLSRNPENFFAQIEQAAFSSGNTVPGIGLSPDKMLLGRAFAYNDAQRNLIGANFHQLPVNRFLRDGLRTEIPSECHSCFTPYNCMMWIRQLQGYEARSQAGCGHAGSAECDPLHDALDAG